MSIDVPSFLSLLQRRDEHPRDAQEYIAFGLGFDEKKDVTDRMVQLLRFETERLLSSSSSVALSPIDHKALSAYSVMIKNEGFSSENGLAIGTKSASTFLSVFCNKDIVIPDCLMEALRKNLEFCENAASLYYRIEDDLEWQWSNDLHMYSDYWPKEDFKDFEIIIRLFPNLVNTDLIDRLAGGAGSVPFVPLMAQLAMEFGVKNRGGLLDTHMEEVPDDGSTILEYVIIANQIDYCKECNPTDFRDIMKEFRDRNLFSKEDIQGFNVVERILGATRHCTNCGIEFLQEPRFRYFANWDPNVLAREDSLDRRTGNLPLHQSTEKFVTLLAFSAVLELGIQHFPIKFGFLFHNNKNGATPFTMACKKYGKEEVIKVVTKILSGNNYDTNAILESLISVVDETVRMEGFCIILRKDPSVVMKGLSLTKGCEHLKRKREIVVAGERDNKVKPGKVKRCA